MNRTHSQTPLTFGSPWKSVWGRRVSDSSSNAAADISDRFKSWRNFYHHTQHNRHITQHSWDRKQHTHTLSLSSPLSPFCLYLTSNLAESYDWPKKFTFLMCFLLPER